jgi:hypothetical protein
VRGASAGFVDEENAVCFHNIYFSKELATKEHKDVEKKNCFVETILTGREGELSLDRRNMKDMKRDLRKGRFPLHVIHVSHV